MPYYKNENGDEPHEALRETLDLDIRMPMEKDENSEDSDERGGDGAAHSMDRYMTADVRPPILPPPFKPPGERS